MTEVSRRALFKATGAIGAAMLPADAATETADAKVPAIATPAATSSFCATPPTPTTYVFFNSEEAAFIEAAVARLIPADEEWPGALEACAPNYIDKQLAGAWGAGERLFEHAQAARRLWVNLDKGLVYLVAEPRDVAVLPLEALGANLPSALPAAIRRHRLFKGACALTESLRREYIRFGEHRLDSGDIAV